MKGQPGFFDLAERHDKLTEMRGPLVVPKKEIDREAFRGDLAKVHEKEKKSAAGAKPRDVVRMFKVLILQQTYNLSDEQIEYPIRDRLSFMRFLGLPMEDKVPDEKTVRLFRERSAEHKLTDALFARCHEPLAGRGFAAQGGQMIDATFVEVPRSRNGCEENEPIKAGGAPKDWDDELIDHAPDEPGDKRPVYAGSACRFAAQEDQLAQAKINSRICEKGARAPRPPNRKRQTKANQKSACASSLYSARRRRGADISCAPSVWCALRLKSV